KRISSGRLLAISSANRVTPNTARKIHSDQTPRLLARKLSRRRRVSGVMRRPRKVSPADVPCSGVNVAAAPLGEAGGGVAICRSGGVTANQRRPARRRANNGSSAPYPPTPRVSPFPRTRGEGRGEGQQRVRPKKYRSL